jgi:sugar fermentation stimulation protein A
MPTHGGLYQLRIRLRQAREIAIGSLGPCRFRAGWYVYTGSARNGLDARLRRHFRPAGMKRLHWHIDYLLAGADAVEAFVWPAAPCTECELHAALPEHAVTIPRFGASDCRCGSHLAYFRSRPPMTLTPWPRPKTATV